MNMYEKLNKIQVSLNAPKNQWNSFGNYSYRSCEDILEGLKPLLRENKAVVTVSDEIVVLGDRGPGESVSNVYVKATATFTDIETGESVSTYAYARHSDNKKGMDDAQITGATSSYARKYALNGLFCIDDNKDPDSMEGEKDNKKPSSTPKAKNVAKSATPKETKVVASKTPDEECPF